MNRFLLGLLLIVGLGAVLWVFGPREAVRGPVAFSAAGVDDDLDAYLFRRERAFTDVVRGAQKHILWANPARKQKTPLSIVYIHGFSATLEEIRPVPDEVARAIGANLFYTRLTGHGRTGAAMGEARLADWRADMAEAIEVGRRLGDRVILMGTSTGGSLVTMALGDPLMSQGVAGAVFFSPNYAIQAEGSNILTWPFARSFIPLILGKERFFAPDNTEHAKWWTTRYPTQALIPMAASVKAANAVDHGDIQVPALFIFSDADQIVKASRTREVAARWGGPVALWPVEAGPGDDRVSHVIAGDILSPGLTDNVVARILEWVRERGF